MNPEVGYVAPSQTMRMVDDARATARQEVAQDASQASFNRAASEDLNPVAMGAKMAKVASTKPSTSARVKRTREAGGKTLLPVESVEDALNKFQEKDSELDRNKLKNLHGKIKELKRPLSKEDVLKAVQEEFLDAIQADEALEFLEATTPEGEDREAIQEARVEFQDKNKRALSAGHAIHAQAQELKKLVGPEKGKAVSYRELYRKITDEMPDPPTLFVQLSQRYSFEEVQKVLKLLYHSLGSDLKSGGPDIPHGQLSTLVKTARALQASFGVYRYFRDKTPLVHKLFAANGMKVPDKLSFEAMSREFVNIVSDYRPTPTSVLQTAPRLGIDNNIPAEMIVYETMRDGVRSVSGSIFGPIEHRNAVFEAVIDALDDLYTRKEELDEANARVDELADAGYGEEEPSTKRQKPGNTVN